MFVCQLQAQLTERLFLREVKVSKGKVLSNKDLQFLVDRTNLMGEQTSEAAQGHQQILLLDHGALGLHEKKCVPDC